MDRMTGSNSKPIAVRGGKFRIYSFWPVGVFSFDIFALELVWWWVSMIIVQENRAVVKMYGLIIILFFRFKLFNKYKFTF